MEGELRKERRRERDLVRESPAVAETFMRLRKAETAEFQEKKLALVTTAGEIKYPEGGASSSAGPAPPAAERDDADARSATSQLVGQRNARGRVHQQLCTLPE